MYFVSSNVAQHAGLDVNIVEVRPLGYCFAKVK